MKRSDLATSALFLVLAFCGLLIALLVRIFG